MKQKNTTLRQFEMSSDYFTECDYIAYGINTTRKFKYLEGRAMFSYLNTVIDQLLRARGYNLEKTKQRRYPVYVPNVARYILKLKEADLTTTSDIYTYYYNEEEAKISIDDRVLQCKKYDDLVEIEVYVPKHVIESERIKGNIIEKLRSLSEELV